MEKTNTSRLDQDKVVQLILAAVILVCGIAGLLDIVETGGAGLTGLAVSGEDCAEGVNFCAQAPGSSYQECLGWYCSPGYGHDHCVGSDICSDWDGGLEGIGDPMPPMPGGPADCDPMTDPTCVPPPADCDPATDPTCVPPPGDDGSMGPEGPMGPDGGTGPGDGSGDGGDGGGDSEDQCEAENACGASCCTEAQRCHFTGSDSQCVDMCNSDAGETECGSMCCESGNTCSTDESGNQACVASCNDDFECQDSERTIECLDCRPEDDEDPCTRYEWVDDQWQNVLVTISEREYINSHTDPWTCQNPTDIPGAGVPIGNGCGPDGWGNFVPESPTVSCDYRFTGPCVRHDQCYQTCRPGGTSQQICDEEFLVDMLRECDTSETENTYCHNRCTEDAYAYQQAVSTGASWFNAFTNSQETKCQCCSTEPGPLDTE